MATMSVVTMLTMGLQTVAPAPVGAQDQPIQENVAFAIDSRVDDVSTEELTLVALATLGDPRGWGQADFTFTSDSESDNRVVLAEPAVVDELCAPIETGGTSSCQNGPVVVLNADSWREVPEGWPDLETYRQYMINHGVGHFLGQFHPSNRCPVPGEPEALMAPQTDGLQGCTANPWPLSWAGTAQPDAVGVEVTEIGSKPARSGRDSSSGAPWGALSIAAVLVGVGAAIAWAWLRRRSKRSGVFDDDEPAGVLDDEAAATVLAETDAVAFDGAVADEGTPLPMTEDEPDYVPFARDDGFGAGGQNASGGEVSPAQRWHVRLSGRAQRDGALLWLAPQRWDPSEVDAFRRAIGDGVAGDGETVRSQQRPAIDDEAQRVGVALGEFLSRRPHLAPGEHEGLGLILLGDDQVVAAVLGAAELVELRSGLAKPVRRRGVMRLRQSDSSPLEVELSVTPPARPRARIIVEPSIGTSSPT